MAFKDIIEKTSKEEGGYGEVVTVCLFTNYAELGGKNPKFMNITLENVTQDKKMQKEDTDFRCSNGLTIETKHDTWITGSRKNYPNGTGNVPYEFATHVPDVECGKIEGFIKASKNVTLKDIKTAFPHLFERYIGCNEKTKSNYIIIVGSQEEKPENRRYRLLKIWVIDTNRFKEYANNCLLNGGTERFHHKWQKEDKANNLMVIIPIANLIKDDIAHELPQHMMNALITKYPELKEYHTSEEIKEILL